MQAEMTEIVMPGDANHLGTCFGGKIMSWIDMVAAIAANRLVGTVVTASVDSIEFKKPIKVGDIVTLQASVNRVWKTSLEVGVRVLVQSHEEDRIFVEPFTWTYKKLGKQKKACRAYLTFVAVTDNGKRRDVSNTLLDISGEEPTRRCHEAEERRQIRLANRRQ